MTKDEIQKFEDAAERFTEETTVLTTRIHAIEKWLASVGARVDARILVKVTVENSSRDACFRYGRIKDRWGFMVGYDRDIEFAPLVIQSISMKCQLVEKIPLLIQEIQKNQIEIANQCHEASKKIDDLIENGIGAMLDREEAA